MDSQAIPFGTRKCWRCGKEFAFFAFEISCLKCKQIRAQNPNGMLLGKALTLREEEMAELVGQGMSNPEIARTLHLAKGTVRIYMGRIFAKTGCKNRVLLAVRMITKQP